MGGADAYRPGGSYDPYKKESIFADKKEKEAPVEKAEKKKKKKSKKKKESSSSDEDSSDEDKSSGEEEEETEKPKRFKKKKGSGVITKPPKKGESKETAAPSLKAPQQMTQAAPVHVRQEQSLIDIFDPLSNGAPQMTQHQPQ